MATSGIPSTGAVSIGDASGNTRSINILMTIAANTPDSTYGTRESNYMNQLLTYGVCMPGQVEKNANWGPTGTGGTYRPTAGSEFRGSYRWTQIVSGNPVLASALGNSPYSLGNGRLQCTGNGSPAYVNSSTPYFFFLIRGSDGARIPGSGWTQATQNNGQTATFTSLTNTTYTVYVKDFEGCGSASNLRVTSVNVPYP